MINELIFLADTEGRLQVTSNTFKVKYLTFGFELMESFETAIIVQYMGTGRASIDGEYGYSWVLILSEIDETPIVISSKSSESNLIKDLSSALAAVTASWTQPITVVDKTCNH